MRTDASPLLACACARGGALAVAGSAVGRRGRAGGRAAVGPRRARRPSRRRGASASAYRQWRSRLQRHRGCTWAATCSRASGQAARRGRRRARRPSASCAGRSTGCSGAGARWLRHDPRGRAVAFKLKVSRSVPSWGKAQLRSIAWCESKNDPRAVGGGGAYRGMYQFSVSTWAVVGGIRRPGCRPRAGSRPGARGCC